jgi:ABC-2 type transport system ATP-binding protein
MLSYAEAMAGTSTPIAITGLRKTFGNTVALDDFDLTVGQGQIHGFLGPNGAGKSTTLRILLGLLRADAGDVELLGGDPWRDAADLHRHLAYVPGDVALWPNLTGGEVIDLLGRMRGALSTRRREELLERFDLDPTKKARAYSKGNRQKVALVAALASDAPLLILDEPTSGLDPLMEEVFREYARQAQAEGRTILLSSHILSEVESLCDRLTIIRSGRTVMSGSLSEMRRMSRTSVSAELEDKAPELSGMPFVHDVVVEDHHVRCTVEPSGLADLLTVLGRHGIRSLTSAPPTLEELFMDLYRDEASDTRDPVAP